MSRDKIVDDFLDDRMSHLPAGKDIEKINEIKNRFEEFGFREEIEHEFLVDEEETAESILAEGIAGAVHEGSYNKETYNPEVVKRILENATNRDEYFEEGIIDFED